MITKIFLIQVHRYPEQLYRLIDALDGPQTYFHIHVDLKSDIGDFRLADRDNVFFTDNRVNCIWGDYSMVKATLNLVADVFAKNYPADSRITLLSGQDYPIKSMEHITDFLEKHKDINFLNIETLTQSGIRHFWNLKAFKINHSDQREDFSLLSMRHISGVLRALFKGKLRIKDLKLLFVNKKVPLNMVAYRGSQWASFNMRTLKKIIAFYQDNKESLDPFFTVTFCPDENFFHTITMHLQKDDPTIKIMPALTYDNWTRKDSPVLPVTFQREDLGELLQQPDYRLFARKFDANFDSSILDDLDKIIHLNKVLN